MFRGLDATLVEMLARQAIQPELDDALQSDIDFFRREASTDVRYVDGDEAVSIRSDGSLLQLRLSP